MSLICSLYLAILFFVLVPGILVSLPPGGKKYTVAAVHALVFGVIIYFTHRFVWRMSSSLEGFQEGNTQYFSDSKCKHKDNKGEYVKKDKKCVHK